MPRPTKGERTPGSGKPKGYKAPATLEKEQARELVRRAVTRDLEGLIAAQIANAKGISYLVVRDRRTGKVLRVTEPMARAAVGRDEEVIVVWSKDPNVQAFTDLMNRALDKPREQLQEFRVTGDEEQIRRLHAGRARAAAARGQP